MYMHRVYFNGTFMYYDLKECLKIKIFSIRLSWLVLVNHVRYSVVQTNILHFYDFVKLKKKNTNT